MSSGPAASAAALAVVVRSHVLRSCRQRCGAGGCCRFWRNMCGLWGSFSLDKRQSGGVVFVGVWCVERKRKEEDQERGKRAAAIFRKEGRRVKKGSRGRVKGLLCRVLYYIYIGGLSLRIGRAGPPDTVTLRATPAGSQPRPRPAWGAVLLIGGAASFDDFRAAAGRAAAAAIV